LTTGTRYTGQPGFAVGASRRLADRDIVLNSI
jgi:hypothetical protein